MSFVLNNIEFSEPEPLIQWNPPNRAGLFAIMIPNKTVKPKPLEVVYLGESGNLNDTILSSHQKKQSWLLQAANNEHDLFISTYLMPKSTEEQRRAIESALINHFKPPCNE